MEQSIQISTETPSIISTYEAERKVEQSRGFIIMVDVFNNPCGIVYNVDFEDSYSWYGQTIEECQSADSIEELIRYFKNYTFKLIS